MLSTGGRGGSPACGTTTVCIFSKYRVLSLLSRSAPVCPFGSSGTGYRSTIFGSSFSRNTGGIIGIPLSSPFSQSFSTVSSSGLSSSSTRFWKIV